MDSGLFVVLILTDCTIFSHWDDKNIFLTSINFLLLSLVITLKFKSFSDGFRKVVHIDSGIVKQERDGPVEFQHPYFKQGQDDLLENIKRKVRYC
jgi:hypothetical protein